MQTLVTNSRTRFLIALVFVVLARSTNAQENASPTEPGGRNSIFANSRACKAVAGNLRVEDITVLNFRLGVSTIRDVEKRFPGMKPVKLTTGEEAEEGICVKNKRGDAAVFATGVMGAPEGTLTTIYLAPARLVESASLKCQSIETSSAAFSSKSGIRVGLTSVQASRIIRAEVPSEGPLCAAYIVPSMQGPLQVNKAEKLREFTDSTGVEGATKKGRILWVGLWGITSN
ncbi:MAG: hypothetical protein HYR55_13980 [Acidobacteria bacterium]|nr:hypothetical protein [Acidobacteriota bacterium]